VAASVIETDRRTTVSQSHKTAAGQIGPNNKNTYITNPPYALKIKAQANIIYS
jgi:hypothetical protein